MTGFAVLTAVPYSGIRQRPQHFVDYFSRLGYKTIYINLYGPNDMDEDAQGSIDHALREFAAGGSVDVSYARTVNANLLVFDGIPVARHRSDSLEYLLQAIQREFGHGDLVFIATYPDWLDHVEKIESRFMLVYDCLDDWEEFVRDLGVGKSIVVHKERKLASIADLVIVSAKKLFVKMQRYSDKIAYLPNGVTAEDYRLEAPPPIEYRDIPEPRVFFMGALHGWVDTELIAYLATRRPQYSFVIVGPIADNIERPENHNIHYLGKKRYSELPAYLQHARVAIIPFKVNKLTVSVTPLKFFEYLASGVPVVTTVMPDIIDVPGSIMANSCEEFLEAVDMYVNMEPLSYEREADKARMSAEGYFWSEMLDRLLSALLSDGCDLGQSLNLHVVYSEFARFASHPVIIDDLMCMAVRLEEFEEAVRLGMGLLESGCQVHLPDLALAYLKMGDLNEAVRLLKWYGDCEGHDWLKKHIDIIMRESSPAGLIEVLTLRLSGRQPEALQLVDAILTEERCSHPLAVGLLASLFAEMYELDLALGALEKVRELADEGAEVYVDPKTLEDLADALCEKRRFEEAESLALALSSYGLSHLSTQKLGDIYYNAFLAGEPEFLLRSKHAP